MNPVDLDLLCTFLPFTWMRVVYNTGNNKCFASDATRRSLQGLLMAEEQTGRHKTLVPLSLAEAKAADSDLIKPYKHDTIILKR